MSVLDIYLQPENWTMSKSEIETLSKINAIAMNKGVSALSPDQGVALNNLSLKYTRSKVKQESGIGEESNCNDVMEQSITGLTFDIGVKTFQISTEIYIEAITPFGVHTVYILSPEGLNVLPVRYRNECDSFINNNKDILIKYWFGMIWSKEFYNGICKNVT